MKVIGPRFQVRVPLPLGYGAAPKAQRRAFWDAASAFVAEAKEGELRARLDRFGVPMAALKPRTIKDRHSEMGPADPHGPQLQPAHGLSRTRALFVAQPTARLDGITCFWSFDEHTGDSWGEVLRHHKAGNRNLPVRDVIGLSPDSLARVKHRAMAWWAVYNDLTASSLVARPPEPGPTPKFMVRRIPANAEPRAAKRVSQLEVNGKSYTFQSGSAAKVRDAIGLGKFSGFHTYEQVQENLARTGTTRTGSGRYKFSFGTKGPPPVREPRPAPPPKPAPTAALKAAAEEQLGVEFAPAPVAKGNPAYTTVVIDVAKADAALARDPGYHVGPGGSGAGIAGRYEEFRRFLLKAKAEGIPIEQPRAVIDRAGEISLGDGRHRFAVLRDLGATILPVSVRRSIAGRLRRLYGAIIGE